MEDDGEVVDGEVVDGERLSTINRLNSKELKIGENHGVASGNPGVELGSKEELESK